MALPPPEPNDYHVGWICTGHDDYVVACELLDYEFPSQRYAAFRDNNVYTCGRIGVHLIVVACLPKGKYGLTSATSVGRDLVRSFPAIQFGMIVGTGGGAPSKKNDIRLGDVAVSTPTGRTGGVIHYEFGKTIQDKQFERAGSLDAPPLSLLSAIQKLGVLHARRGHRIQETIENLFPKNSRLRTQYTKPIQETDVLYESSFVHHDPSQSCDATCSHDHAVQRDPRDELEDNPVVFYGLIASADRLMQNADVRDQLAESEGVLCFEMEAAGLMDQIPCVVIRGICNYSDTHKNDVWQGYAAAAAAAYAKELLQVIPSRNFNSAAEAKQHESEKQMVHLSKSITSSGLTSLALIEPCESTRENNSTYTSHQAGLRVPHTSSS